MHVMKRLLSVGCLSWMLAGGLMALTATPALAQVDAITTASYDLRLGFTVDGKLRDVPVKAGDNVKKGDLLMALSPRVDPTSS